MDTRAAIFNFDFLFPRFAFDTPKCRLIVSGIVGIAAQGIFVPIASFK
jgi:hypothetical protein